MTNAGITILIAGTCGMLALAAFVWFIAWPAWNAYSKTWDVAAGFLSLYVFAALLLSEQRAGRCSRTTGTASLRSL